MRHLYLFEALSKNPHPATPEHVVYAWKAWRAEGRPVSVGLGLLGQAACGAVDSVGNAWEWTVTPSHANGGDVRQMLVDADSDDPMVGLNPARPEKL